MPCKSFTGPGSLSSTYGNLNLKYHSLHQSEASKFHKRFL
jgi:hypothetical protein